jgi:hypothetical protein
MSGGANDHTTAHKGGDEPDLLELEEPETVDVVIDGTSPSDYPDEGKGKQWRPRILWAVSALMVVSITLGVSFGLTAKKNSPPPQSASVNEFLRGLPSYSLELANDDDSPQAKALAWLQKDPQYSEYELYRLCQRYALAVLYLSTNGTSWYSKWGWLSNDNECSWYQHGGSGPEDGSSCVEDSRLSFLDLNENNLDGSIPTELALLTDLEFMSFYGEKLSGLIHSELCVSQQSCVQ